MKSTIAGITVIAALVPAVASARTVANFRSQTIAILRHIVDLQQQLISVLQAEVSQFQANVQQPAATASSQQRAAPVPTARSAQMTTTSDVRRGSSSISVITSADAGSIVQGTALTISWQTSNAPAGSAVALMPQKALTGHIFDPIASALPTSGSHTWHVPIFVMQPIPCAPDITGGCIGSMNPTTYKIVARLYTPADANLTEFGPGKTYPTWIAWTESDAFTMLAAPAVPSK
jgi:hypothetical protein